MDLQFNKTIYKINFYGSEYEMRKPTVRETVNFQKTLASLQSEDEKLLGLMDFFISLGLPKEIVESMQIDHIVELSEKLSASDKKK